MPTENETNALLDGLRRSGNPHDIKVADHLHGHFGYERYLYADVVIVGSGPIAATYARTIREKAPDTSIIMVEAGSQEDPVIGGHHKNAIRYQKNPDAFVPYIETALEPVSVPQPAFYLPTLPSVCWTPTAGPFFARGGSNPEQIAEKNLPAAAVVKTVGGMASVWACAFPTPDRKELVGSEFPIDNGAFSQLIERAESYLKVVRGPPATNQSNQHRLVKNALSSLGPDAIVHTPLAVGYARASGPRINTWSGADTILGDQPQPFITMKRVNMNDERDVKSQAKYRLLKDTNALSLFWGKEDGGGGHRVLGVNAHDLRTETVKDDEWNVFLHAGKAVVLACGAVGTPQLLYNSQLPDGGARQNVGRWLSEQTMAFCQVVLKRSIVRENDPLSIPRLDLGPQIYVKYKPENEYTALIDRGAAVRPEVDPRVVVDLRFYCKNDIQKSNCVKFGKRLDTYGMPQPTFDFTKSDADRDRENKMVTDMARIAGLLGGFLPGSGPQILPMGSAQHITGTTRIGHNKDSSVADPQSRVHDFTNLWVGGNGCIPIAMACSPTLTSMAIAIHGAEALCQYLKPVAVKSAEEMDLF